MNKAFYQRKFVVRPERLRPVLFSENKQLFFATGNSYYPKTRKSVGVQVLNAAVDRLGLKWDEDELFWKAELSRVTFVKPKLYLPQFYAQSLRSAMESASIKLMSSVTLLVPNPNLKVGVSASGSGAFDEKLPDVDTLLDELQNEQFNWISLGVGADQDAPYKQQLIFSTACYTTQDALDELFMNAKIPTRDQDKLERDAMEPLLRQWQNAFIKG